MRKEELSATQDSPNLYEWLGGVDSIATVVDDLIDRVMADQRLNANPLVDDAHHKLPPAGFKYMQNSHRHLRITAGEWDAFMDDVARTLDKFAVPPAVPALRGDSPLGLDLAPRCAWRRLFLPLVNIRLTADMDRASRPPLRAPGKNFPPPPGHSRSLAA